MYKAQKMLAKVSRRRASGSAMDSPGTLKYKYTVCGKWLTEPVGGLDNVSMISLFRRSILLQVGSGGGCSSMEEAGSGHEGFQSQHTQR
jgi:hypothetical protein